MEGRGGGVVGGDTYTHTHTHTATLRWFTNGATEWLYPVQDSVPPGRGALSRRYPI